MILLLACTSEPTDALESDEALDVVFEDGWIQFDPTGERADTAIVFYPGGFVGHQLYAQPLRGLAERGYTVAAVSMPLDLAVIAPNKADKVIEAVFAERWVIAGHSLGGSMAGRYATEHDVAGLALWASYLAEADDLSGKALPVLSLTGTEDDVLDGEKHEAGLARLPADTVQVSIEGGNHAGFGDYGAQKGDGARQIELEEQHAQIVDAMEDFLIGL